MRLPRSAVVRPPSGTPFFLRLDLDMGIY
jgi:hypothetical protein